MLALKALRAHMETLETQRAELISNLAAKKARHHTLLVQKWRIACETLELPLAARMRAVFELRTLATPEAASALIPSLKDKRNGSLLRHEVGFCLGQMGQTNVVEEIMEVLDDLEDDVIVRHEAAEALGGLLDPRALPSLERHFKDPSTPIEVRETCDLALRRFQEANLAGGADQERSKFETTDPAILPKKFAQASTKELGAKLMDASSSLYERYRAMFALRNRVETDEDAVLELCRGFDDAKSALFRHEIAYVLGQIASPKSVPRLMEVLRDAKEHDMVRHEAAEALGAVGDEECVKILESYKRDQAAIVAESCVVALDATEYWKDFNEAE